VGEALCSRVDVAHRSQNCTESDEGFRVFDRKLDGIEQPYSVAQGRLGLAEPLCLHQRHAKMKQNGRMLHRVPIRRIAVQASLELADGILGSSHVDLCHPTGVRILVAGVGNILRGDDGFGVVAAHRLADEGVPEEVNVLDVGIGGIHMVQELLDPVEGLVVLDAVDLARPPGTVLVLRPEVVDVHGMTPQERHDHLADMHYATPERALMLARGLGVLPDSTWIVGCQPGDADRWGEILSPPVENAIGAALEEVRRIVNDLGVEWVGKRSHLD
jgi:hydrogenase maturation protease